ncbi:MAG TPA: TylF/MycF/NovP-related O-methyltransferase [Waterburya sp.]|jgi:O-methyltransferase
MINDIARGIKNYLSLDDTRNLLRKIQPYTMCTEERLHNLIRLANYVNSEGIEGDFVECGTCKGGTAALLSKYMNESRHLWIYDSFEGMPSTSAKDGEEAKKWVGECVGSVEDVIKIMKLVSTTNEKFTIKKGWFDQTFKENKPKKIALLHCDADWYDSVTLVLDTFYELVTRGGCIILDDFGYWEGCREAFYDFCIKTDEKPLLERVGNTQAFWIKGLVNNRIIKIKR